MSAENVELVRTAVEAYQHPEVLALLASGDRSPERHTLLHYRYPIIASAR
jgi:hypothetical protein